MALTPEDVVNKQFQQTKFREGYDQDEVDDFLDEVVVELRRLIQENQDLQEKLEKAQKGQPVAAEAPAAQPVAAVPATPVAAAVPATPVAAAPVASEQDASESSASLLQLARRLHDEHVREGSEKRDELVAEGHATAARLVAEAEAEQRKQLAELGEKRQVLDRKIDELRVFEREYRQKLRSYIEGQLKELDDSPAGSGAVGGNGSLVDSDSAK